ncbi:hypothetical protein Back2_22200 [Nocardioides baekrokdamisoli]|uniref:Uncharacterized protein n=1 Tax=Nocardioides baekrokdamisoli TaxID=1804624 RepID=A0A3G9J005_9ACTN|nr:hypothetical protein [Nocardioides baekrokdamisoli]BBH17933.1 hypothetical protein Back2_22200 [Nocardioides baekrokdamisoli]
MGTSSINGRVAGDFLIVEVARRWRLGRTWQVQIRRRDNDRLLQHLACGTYTEAETLARRAEKDLASDSLDAFCHTYLITRAAVR